MQIRNILLVTILALSRLALSSADAETITFSGHVDTVPEALMSKLQPEMSITGFYTYDESLAVDQFIRSVTDFQMVIGDYQVGQDPTSTRGDISLTPSNYTVVSIASGEQVADQFAPMLMALQLSSSSEIVELNSPLPPPIEEFDNPLWTFDFSSAGPPLRVVGTIESLMVPEPTTGRLLAVVGIIAGPLALRRRRYLRRLGAIKKPIIHRSS